MALALTAAAGAFGALNGYWGQAGLENLRDHCDSGIDTITLGFVNASPENEISGYPATNFGPHCWATTYDNPQGVPSRLLSQCQSIKRDIPYCKSKGVKIILSIGGDYVPGSNYKVTTEKNGESFADFLYRSFGPYRSDWIGPRPFDSSETEHTSVDGFDFDIEAKLDNKPYIAMINRFRSLDSSLLITGAPQCPTNPLWFYMKDMVQQAAFDKLFIQFYNNPSCEVISPPLSIGAKFNYDDWEDIIAKSAKSKSAKLYIGLPASVDAGSGYIDPKTLKDLVCKYKDRPHFGGISLWDLSRGYTNVVNGKTYNQHVLDALKYGCNPVPTTTTSTVASTTMSKASTTTSAQSTTTTSTTTTSTSTSAQSTTTSAPVKTTTTSTSVEPVTTSTSTEYATTTTPVEHTTATSDDLTTTTPVEYPTTTPVEHVTTTSDDLTTTSPVEYPTTTPVEHVTTASTEIGTSIEVPTTTPIEHVTTTSDEPVVTATATSTSTSVEVPTTAPVESTSVVTTFPTLTLTSKWSNSTTSRGSATATTTGPASISMTTSTVYTTSVHTVTKCPPYVVDCPSTGYVTTQTIPLYTTVCPVSTTTTAPKPTITKASSLPLTTSTVYATKTYTITSCAPQVTNCPVGHVTTETIPLYTTVCPVTATATATASVPGGPNPPEGTPIVSQPAETTKVTYPGNGPDSTSLQTVVRPTTVVVVPQPSGGEGCTGPSCPGQPGKPTSILGTGYPGVPSVPGGVVPTGSQTGTPAGPSTVPSNPVTAGASMLGASVMGLVAMVAIQVFAL